MTFRTATVRERTLSARHDASVCHGVEGCAARHGRHAEAVGCI
jgi:hypothetical protein